MIENPDAEKHRKAKKWIEARAPKYVKEAYKELISMISELDNIVKEMERINRDIKKTIEKFIETRVK
ncbi:hypothetical protein LCGC14_2417370 [marine sediment metagenome]|uniref:Uncharacterized protein n=1 Tax=marine sediment metagenome TaxID=412755 RepID=A0A0F9E2W6_9ZZZZ